MLNAIRNRDASQYIGFRNAKEDEEETTTLHNDDDDDDMDDQGSVRSDNSEDESSVESL